MSAAPETHGTAELASIVADQQRRISGLTAELREGTRAGSPGNEDRRLGYRFDAAPKWLCESGWREQSPEHRKAWPLLWRLLELERWPGARIRVTKKQLAGHLGVSEDTVKRRLGWLEEHKTLSVTPGSGRKPSTVVIQHPIATPLAYDEVPWPAGGLMDAPPGYLENLRGAARAYAVLYGVQLPEAEGTQEPPEHPPPLPVEVPPPPVEPADPVEQYQPPPRAPAETLGPLPAHPGGAPCPPSEMGDGSLEVPRITPDARTREAAPEQEERTGRESTPAQKLEKQATEIARTEITGGAIADARRICDALDRDDELTAARAAQVAELLARKRWAYLLTDACARIRSARRGQEIRRPIPYLCATLVSAAEHSGLTDDERALAAEVLGGAQAPKRRTAAELMKGYECLFDEPDSDSSEPSAGSLTPREELKKVEEELDALGDKPYGWFFGEKVPKGIQQRHDYLKRRKRELEARIRRRGHGWLFDD